MTHKHAHDGRINVYERKLINGNGIEPGSRFYQKGTTVPPINIGDKFSSIFFKNTLLVDKIISQQNSKGIFKNPSDSEMALYEAELIVP